MLKKLKEDDIMINIGVKVFDSKDSHKLFLSCKLRKHAPHIYLTIIKYFRGEAIFMSRVQQTLQQTRRLKESLKHT